MILASAMTHLSAEQIEALQHDVDQRYRKLESLCSLES